MAENGAILSIEHDDRRFIGFEKAAGSATSGYRIHFILWDESRTFHELARAVDAIGSSGYPMDAGSPTGPDSLAERCRVVLQGERNELQSRAKLLATAVRSAFAIPESAVFAFALSSSSDVDRALLQQRRTAANA